MKDTDAHDYIEGFQASVLEELANLMPDASKSEPSVTDSTWDDKVAWEDYYFDEQWAREASRKDYERAYQESRARYEVEQLELREQESRARYEVEQLELREQRSVSSSAYSQDNMSWRKTWLVILLFGILLAIGYALIRPFVEFRSFLLSLLLIGVCLSLVFLSTLFFRKRGRSKAPEDSIQQKLVADNMLRKDAQHSGVQEKSEQKVQDIVSFQPPPQKSKSVNKSRQHRQRSSERDQRQNRTSVDSEKPQERVKLEAVAKELVKRRDVMKYLCPALQSASNDVYDVAKITTPILIPLVLAGTIAIPLNPLLFALIALTISRMGIASLCIDHNKNIKDKTQD
jgi:hypothetical protein